MVLVDTSVWINHFKKRDLALDNLLRDGTVLIHPFVIEELALGKLAHREEILQLLEYLPKAPSLTHSEALIFISKNNLAASGLGLIDTYLLASAYLAKSALWTYDTKLQRLVSRFGLVPRLN